MLCSTAYLVSTLAGIGCGILNTPTAVRRGFTAHLRAQVGYGHTLLTGHLLLLPYLMLVLPKPAMLHVVSTM